MSLLVILGIASMAFTAWFTWFTWRASGGKRKAIVEAWINICLGFSINFVLNFLIVPLMVEGGTVTAHGNFWGGWMFTAASMLRQYAIRRWCQENIDRFATWIAVQLDALKAKPL